jgi:hypothetical protein
MLELGALDAIDYAITRTFPTDGCEFYVTLRRGRHTYAGVEGGRGGAPRFAAPDVSRGR